MALIHWWPLDNNLEDKIAKTTITGIYEEDINGKLGKCLKNSTSGFQTSVKLADEWSHWKHSVSMSCWVKVNYEECNTYVKELNYTNSATTPTGSIIGQVSYGGLGIYWQANKIYDGSNIGDLTTINVRGFTRGNSSSAYTSTYKLESDTWYHLTLVADYNNKMLKFYVNGTQIGAEASYASIPEMTDNRFFGWGRREVFGGNGPGGSLPMKLNDIRLYNHALSKTEIKELSQALIIHYSFNDRLAESTTNLVTGLIKGGRTTLDSSGKIITTSGEDADTYFYLNFSKTLEAGKVYTISCTGEGIIQNSSNKGEFFQFGLQGQGGVPQFKIYNGRSSLTFTATETQAVNRLLLDDITGARCLTQCRFYDFQLEEKDHMTPYTPASREGRLIDESGYNHSGTIYNSSFTTDTASGSLSCHTPRVLATDNNGHASSSNAGYLYADIFGYNHTPDEFTVAWWWKATDWGYGNGPFGLVIGVTDYLNSTIGVHDGSAKINYAGGNTKNAFSFTAGGRNVWHHFAITYKPGKAISYVNGVKHTEHSPDATLILDPWRYLYLGACSAGGVLRDGDIYWGDFRYYSTCLSEQDIQNLYKAKAEINKQGNVYGNEFIELGESCNLIHSTQLEQGGITDASGANSNNMANRIRTLYIPIMPDTTYYGYAGPGYHLRGYHFYDKDKQWISYSTNRIVTSPSNAKYVRIPFQCSEPSAALNPSQVDLIQPTLLPFLGEAMTADTSITVEITKNYQIKTRNIVELEEAEFYEGGTLNSYEIIEN